MIIVQLDSEQLGDLIQSSVRKALVENQSQPNDSNLQPEQLLTVQQTAEFLNLSVQTIYSKVSKGELPVMKRAKQLYFSSTELMEYLKAGRKKTTAEIQVIANQYLANKSDRKRAK